VNRAGRGGSRTRRETGEFLTLKRRTRFEGRQSSSSAEVAGNRPRCTGFDGSTHGIALDWLANSGSPLLGVRRGKTSRRQSAASVAVVCGVFATWNAANTR
jgi:hypothetical protein